MRMDIGRVSKHIGQSSPMFFKIMRNSSLSGLDGQGVADFRQGCSI